MSQDEWTAFFLEFPPVPSQWKDCHGTMVAANGLQKLLMALLREAAQTYLKGDRLERLEVREWINSPNRGSIFTFEGVCEFFDLDVARARKRVHRLMRIADRRRIRFNPRSYRSGAGTAYQARGSMS